MSHTNFESRPYVLLLSALAAMLLSGCVTDGDLTGSRFEPYRMEDRYPLTTKDALAIRRLDPAELCNNWTQDLAVTWRNNIHPNHGCATRVNMANQIADPNDIDRPNAVTPHPEHTSLRPLPAAP